MVFTVFEAPPCNKCVERDAECHATCGRYFRWLEKRRSASATSHREAAAKGFLVDNRLNRASRMQRGVGTKIKMRNVWGR